MTPGSVPPHHTRRSTWSNAPSATGPSAPSGWAKCRCPLRGDPTAARRSPPSTPPSTPASPSSTPRTPTHSSVQEHGHGERLVAEALATYGGPTDDVLVATKGGHRRPGDGSWTVHGDPAYVKEACEASLKALGVDAIGLYQYHRPDPSVPWAESVGALADLLDEGKILMAGVSNATVAQIDEAQEVLSGRLVSVQNEFSRASAPRRASSSTARSSASCSSRGARMGGIGALRPDRGELPGLRRGGAAEVGASPQQVTLAWMLAKSSRVIPIPGSSRPETAIASRRGRRHHVDTGPGRSPRRVPDLDCAPEGMNTIAGSEATGADTWSTEDIGDLTGRIALGHRGQQRHRVRDEPCAGRARGARDPGLSRRREGAPGPRQAGERARAVVAGAAPPRPGRPLLRAPGRRRGAVRARPARPPREQRGRDGHSLPPDGGRLRAADGHEPPRPLRADGAAPRPHRDDRALAHRHRQLAHAPHRPAAHRTTSPARRSTARGSPTGPPSSPTFSSRPSSAGACRPRACARWRSPRTPAGRGATWRGAARRSGTAAYAASSGGWPGPCSANRRQGVPSPSCAPPRRPRCARASTSARRAWVGSTARPGWRDRRGGARDLGDGRRSGRRPRS